MAKQPYIPLYIGDWEQDTNCLSPLAEFALLKLTFKLFKSEKRGVFITTIRTLSVLFKSNMDETQCIFQELIDNNVLNISALNDSRYEIISRRMIREATISEIRSESGRLGGIGKKANVKQNKSKTKAKAKQNADIDNEYIVKLLNEKSGKSFDSKTPKTVSLINTLKKQGFVKEDFEKVITSKCKEWKDNTKMAKYLRPETLFSGKFEGYLQEIPKVKLSNEPSMVSNVPMTSDEIDAMLRPPMLNFPQ